MIDGSAEPEIHGVTVGNPGRVVRQRDSLGSRTGPGLD